MGRVEGAALVKKELCGKRVSQRMEYSAQGGTMMTRYFSIYLSLALLLPLAARAES